MMSVAIGTGPKSARAGHSGGKARGDLSPFEAFTPMSTPGPVDVMQKLAVRIPTA
jgi:hypothetical protein